EIYGHSHFPSQQTLRDSGISKYKYMKDSRSRITTRSTCFFMELSNHQSRPTCFLLLFLYYN
ncbi:unnamed protein product, partial [Prunus brigantina]